MDRNLRKFCVAPMMGYTTPHARRLYRILSKKAFLFTEMIACKTLIYSNKKDDLIENLDQNPIALQVGGSDINDLIKCSKIAEKNHYNEINLNVGCPSKAVKNGGFGACLMKKKFLVRDCLKAMLDNSNIEVTIKCRLGIDNYNSYEYFRDFIDTIVQSGITIVYVHARNAILQGLNPKQNRAIPPLNYDFVKKIKKDFPNIQFIINGGINTLNQAHLMINHFDGVMLGRLIQSNPFCLLNVDKIFFSEQNLNKENKIIISEYFDYIKQKINEESIFRLLSPLLCIFFNIPFGKKYKSEIHQKMKNYEIGKLEKLFLEFVN